jgi:hypothetical protein
MHNTRKPEGLRGVDLRHSHRGGLVHKQRRHDGHKILMPTELHAPLRLLTTHNSSRSGPFCASTIIKDWAVNTDTYSHPPPALLLMDVQQITSRLGSPRHCCCSTPRHTCLLLHSRMMRYLCFPLAWVAHLRLCWLPLVCLVFVISLRQTESFGSNGCH